MGCSREWWCLSCRSPPLASPVALPGSGPRVQCSALPKRGPAAVECNLSHSLFGM